MHGGGFRVWGLDNEIEEEQLQGPTGGVGYWLQAVPVALRILLIKHSLAPLEGRFSSLHLSRNTCQVQEQGLNYGALALETLNPKSYTPKNLCT